MIRVHWEVLQLLEKVLLGVALGVEGMVSAGEEFPHDDAAGPQVYFFGVIAVCDLFRSHVG